MKRRHIRLVLLAAAVVLSAMGIYTGNGNDGGWHLEETVQAASADYILPQSADTVLTTADIEGLSLQAVCYAKNEIYARRGRLFKSQELMDYFNSKSWYSGTISPENFTDNLLSATEYQNAQFLANVEHQINESGYQLDQPGYDITQAGGQTEVDSASAVESMLSGHVVNLGSRNSLDLDQDGTEERISLSVDYQYPNEIENKYILQAGDLSVTDTGEAMDNEIWGFSLDGKNILLIVYEYGPSDDPCCTFFKYTGDTLIRLGQIPAAPDNFVADGGVIKTRIRCNVMGTMAIETQYMVDQNNTLTRMNQDVYTYSKNFRYPSEEDDFFAYLKQNLIVHEERDAASVATEMTPQNVRFPYTDSENWVYVEGSTGQGGWLYVGDWSYSRRRDVFDHLQMYD